MKIKNCLNNGDTYYLYKHYTAVIMPQWAESQRHKIVGLRVCVCVVYVSVCVCVCVCVCVTQQIGFLKARDKLSADTCNIGTIRQYFSLVILNDAFVFWLQHNLLTLMPVARRITSSQQVACQPCQLDSYVYATGQATTQVKT